MVGACRRHMVNIWSQDILLLWLDHEPLEENECDSVNRARASCVWWDAGVESFRYHVCLIIYRNVCCGLSQEQLHVNKLSPVLPCAWCEEWTYRGSHASGGKGACTLTHMWAKLCLLQSHNPRGCQHLLWVASENNSTTLYIRIVLMLRSHRWTDWLSFLPRQGCWVIYRAVELGSVILSSWSWLTSLLSLHHSGVLRGLDIKSCCIPNWQIIHQKRD